MIPAPNIYGTAGGQLPEFPAIRFQLLKADEFPEIKRNYFCDVEANLSTTLSLEESDGYDYDEQIANHMSVAGTTEEWLGNSLDTDDLETTVDGFTNSLTVYDIYVNDLFVDIDASDGLLQHKWNLKVVLFHGL